jgi:uncharacterized membrane protein YgcG
MDATFFIWLAGLAITLLVIWKVFAHTTVRHRHSRGMSRQSSSPTSHDAMNYLPMADGGFQSYDTPIQPQPESISSWESSSPPEGNSHFDSGSGFSDSGGGFSDSGGGGCGGGGGD